MTHNTHLLNWISEMTMKLSPANVVWVDGSEKQRKELIDMSVAEGELITLNQEKLPGCYLHRSDTNDVARVEDRTFICTTNEEDAGATNNWMDKDECKKMLSDIYTNSMKGRTMYVVPFVMGPVGSKFAKVGVEITDSKYVVINMLTMTHAGDEALKQLGDSDDFTRCIHCLCEISQEKRYICHFPEENEVISVNSGYGGNALLGKKCMALRIASYLGKKEGWMAEHMLILGIENSRGETKYISAAFPSACGKTNLAMLIPPEGYRTRGYKIFCVGDDIAWMHIGEDGGLWAVNPENGFFGVAPGTNAKTNFNALASTMKDTIFTNVALNADDNTVWWEGLTKEVPKNLIDWKGEAFDPASGSKAAHPNSRFTSYAKNCPCVSKRFNEEDGEGAPISAILFGGRRAKTAPLIYEAFDWNHGVFVGSSMASETTAAAAGAVGQVRRDPMAMKPFCGYNIGDYFSHWLNMGEKLGDKAPRIFHVNWFKTDNEGKFIWPGFGDNVRVLDWILERCEGRVNAVTTPIGYIPSIYDLDTNGLDLTLAQITELLNVDRELWKEEVELINAFYEKVGDSLPEELQSQLNRLRNAVSVTQNSSVNSVFNMPVCVMG